ncbi:MAG: BREX-1 system adenine-specific DNA-methyltransferase PglX [Methanomassiliicoccaceae archaeon]|nr:BREX-1 system adenine-specific DNA-methyltransferase PglX [Methanomassiliicoccaceae archaeon]
MDKGAIEKFAISSRVKLRQSVEQRMAALGITADGVTASAQVIGDVVILNLSNGMETRLTKDESGHRDQLIKEVGRAGYDNVIESVAYTWFNRLIAIRYMEVNDFLPTHVRVLSSTIPGRKEPDLISQCLQVDLGYSPGERDRIIKLKDAEESDRLFGLLFLIQCRELNKILPELFTITKSYENLLLKISFTDPNSVVRDLVDTIPEDDFRDAVQIIGWMYQYYNSELKDDTFAKLKKNVKISKERIPSATQLFTPDWIVRYMVENSVGRIWLEGHKDDSLKAGWKYYLDEAKQEPEVVKQLESLRTERKKLTPEDIRVIDPCMGSGHILVYAFDVLIQIYESYGYSRSEAAISIVEKNLYGLDVDDRAYQLAYFAVMMKARQYNRNVFDKHISNNIHAIVESDVITDDVLKGYGSKMGSMDRYVALSDINYLITQFKNGKTYGSLITLKTVRWDFIDAFLKDRSISVYNSPEINERLNELVAISKVLSQKYDVVTTNPPYSKKAYQSEELGQYLAGKYSDYSPDLYSTFIKRCSIFLNNHGYCGMITQTGFLFKAQFKKMRASLRCGISFNSIVRLGPGAFEEIQGEVVQSVMFVFCNGIINNNVVYVDLFSVKGSASKENIFLQHDSSFESIKSPICDDLDKNAPLFESCYHQSMSIISKIGCQPGSELVFLWWEVEHNNPIYVPYNKGGKYRKWYGNQLWVLKYGLDGNCVYRHGGQTSNKEYYFKESISWTRVSSKMNMRYYPTGFVFDNTSPCIFNDIFYLLGYYNSPVSEYVRITTYAGNKIESGHVIAIAPPYHVDISQREHIESLVKDCISISKRDWDSRELSWNYQKCPLLGQSTIKEGYKKYNLEMNETISTLHKKENEIYEYFIDQLTSDEYIFSSDDIQKYDYGSKIIQMNQAESIKQLLSYAVGCMFGRYSLDVDGLVYAGGQWDSSKYTKFTADADNIIPLNEDEYFGDDIVTRFIEFIKIVFGKDFLEDNLKYIADCLEVKGSGSSRDKIRTYFLKDFYKDHLKMYSNLPIYWLFDSGKENGFKALVYLHRYDENLIVKMRQNYLLPMQRRYIDHIGREKDQVKRTSIQKKLDEIERYDLAMELYASNPVSIDLDDGVKVNYAKFQNIENSKSSKDKINLLYKI